MYRILIADDEPHIIRGLKRMIDWEDCGFEICAAAETGGEALELFDRLHPDLVMLDIMMPVYNGVETAGLLRERGYRGDIVILTGYSDIEYAREAVKHRVKYYLNKPMNAGEITEVLKSVCETLKAREREDARQNMAERLAAKPAAGFDRLSDYAEGIARSVNAGDADAAARLVREAVTAAFLGEDPAGAVKVLCAYVETTVLNMLTESSIDAYEELDGVCGELGGSREEIAEYLTELCREAVGLMRESAADADSIFAQAEKYAREHYREEIMLKELAGSLYISPGYLGSLFSKKAGAGFGAYVHSLRMEEIVRGMFLSGRPIKDISYDAGYNNYNNFFRWFYRFFGCSPEEFKKAMYLM